MNKSTLTQAVAHSVSIKNLSMQDVGPLVRIANHPSIGRNMISLPIPFDKTDALELINECNGRNFIKGIVEHNTDNLVGIIKLRNFEKEHELIELSLWINHQWWGKGYAKQATFQMLKLAFNTPGINRVYAYCLHDNEKCIRVLESTGFKKEGLLRQRVKKNNEYKDVFLLSILKQEWK